LQRKKTLHCEKFLFSYSCGGGKIEGAPRFVLDQLLRVLGSKGGVRGQKKEEVLEIQEKKKKRTNLGSLREVSGRGGKKVGDLKNHAAVKKEGCPTERI